MNRVLGPVPFRVYPDHLLLRRLIGDWTLLELPIHRKGLTVFGDWERTWLTG
jgi:hypothetical protein